MGNKENRKVDWIFDLKISAYSRSMTVREFFKIFDSNSETDQADLEYLFSKVLESSLQFGRLS